MSLKTLLEGSSPFALSMPRVAFAPEGEGDGGAPAAEGAAAEGGEAEAEAEGGDHDGQAEAEGGEGAAGEGGEAEGEFVEIEGEDGVTYQVPKSLAPRFMMHKDYTEKTMQLGEQRRGVETERERITREAAQVQEAQKFVQSFTREVALISNISEQLAEYEKVDWNAWAQSDPNEARKHQVIRDELARKRDNLMSGVENAVRERSLKEQQTARERETQAEAETRRHIKDWSPQKAEQLTKTAVDAYGFTPGEIQSFLKIDPRVARVLNDVATFHAAKAKGKPAVVPVTAKPVVKIGGGSARVAKDPEKMTGDEYKAWWNAKNAGRKAS